MPRANIYIRKDNEEAWAKIADKSAWVNAILSADVAEAFRAEATPRQPTKTTGNQSSPGEIFAGKTCKNGHILQPGRDRCMEKGCKYSVYS